MFSAPRKLARRVAWWLDRDRNERELREEMETHAALRGRREFGNATGLAEQARGVWIPRPLEEFVQDVRFGARQLAHDPLFTAVSLGGLALAIGLVTLVVSFVNAMFWRPLPVKHAGRVARIGAVDDQGRWKPSFSREEAAHYRVSGALEALVECSPDDRVTAEWPAGPSRAIVFQTAGFFETFGADMLAGRFFETGEREPVAVLTEQAWRRRMNADPAVVGRVISLNRQPFTIVGIMADRSAAILDAPADILLPRGFERALELDERGANTRLTGRWAEDSSLAQSQAALDVASARWFAAHPEIASRYRIQVSPARLVSGSLTAAGVWQAGMLIVAVILVLAIACINLANLMLARAESRRREIGARLALGAGRARLVRQLLTECLIVTTLAGAAGMVMSEVGSRTFVAWLNGAVPAAASYLWLDTSMDHRTFLCTLAVCAGTAVLTGMWPAREALKTDLLTALRSGAGTAAAGGGSFSGGVRSVLIVVQLAACSVLLVATASLASALGALERQLLGLDAKPVIQVPLPLIAYGYDAAKGHAMAERIAAGARALPGVSAAGLSAFPMMIVLGESKEIEVEGYGGPKPRTSQIMGVSRGALAAMALGPVRGRDFTDAETASKAPAVIVNERFARELWPGRDAVDQYIRIDPAKGWLRVAGVARDIADAAGGMSQYQIYLPQTPSNISYLLVRASGDRDRLMGPIRSMIGDIDPKLSVNPTPLQSIVDFTSLGPKLASAGARAVALAALAMAVLGLYGVTAYAAARRTHELGIRITLGAQRFDVLSLVFRQGAVLVAVGLLVGAAGGYASEKALGSWLKGLEKLPLTAYLLNAGLQAAVVSAAMLVPSWRATRVDPLNALRHD